MPTHQEVSRYAHRLPRYLAVGLAAIGFAGAAKAPRAEAAAPASATTPDSVSGGAGLPGCAPAESKRATVREVQADMNKLARRVYSDFAVHATGRTALSTAVNVVREGKTDVVTITRDQLPTASGSDRGGQFKASIVTATKRNGSPDLKQVYKIWLGEGDHNRGGQLTDGTVLEGENTIRNARVTQGNIPFNENFQAAKISEAAVHPVGGTPPEAQLTTDELTAWYRLGNRVITMAENSTPTRPLAMAWHQPAGTEPLAF